MIATKKMTANRSDEISAMLADETKHWEKRNEDEKDNRVAIHGAVCELLYLTESAEILTRDWLLLRLKAIKENKVETSIYKLFNISIARNDMRAKAIIRVGKKLNEIIENKTEKPVD